MVLVGVGTHSYLREEYVGKFAAATDAHFPEGEKDLLQSVCVCVCVCGCALVTWEVVALKAP
eukprot:1960559-Amphidinium_carterae.1